MRMGFGKVKSVGSNIVGHAMFGFFVASWCITSSIGYIWDHEPLWAAFTGIAGIGNLIATVAKRTQHIPGFNLVVASGIDPDRLQEIDERFADCARKLGQEPTSQQMIEVVTDLRGIIKDLHP